MSVLKLAEILRRGRSEKRGSMAIIIAITLPVLIGFLGLGVDVTNWYLAKRKVQTAVDSGAISGALTLSYTSDSGAAKKAAIDGTDRNDFAAGSGNTLEINIPPISGAYTTDTNAVEVIATQDQELLLAGVVFGGTVTVEARGVATMTIIVGEYCILGLDTEMDQAVEFDGTSDVDVGCGVAANSHSDQAISIWGNADLSATPVSAVGDISVGGAGVLKTSSPLRSFQYPFVDPYGAQGKNIAAPYYGGCDESKLRINNDTTLNPGVYCNGIDIRAGATVEFNPGMYVIDGGDFLVAGNATLIGKEVTFFLTGNGNDYATVKFAGGTVANLSAPTDGPYEGILFYQDSDAPSFQGATLIKNQFLGGSDMNLTGVLYFPAQDLVYTGGSTIGSTCLQIIARKVTFSGNGAIDNNCPPDMVLESIVSFRVTLVE